MNSMMGASEQLLSPAAKKLLEAIQQISAGRDLASVMAVVRRAARELTGADGATFVIRDGARCYYADEDAISPLWKGQRFPMETCISGWAMTHREAVAIPDIFNDPRIPQDAYRQTFVRSLAIVPIRAQDPVGAVGTYWAQIRETTPQELELLQALANATAVALENARLLEEVTGKSSMLEGVFANMSDGAVVADEHGRLIKMNKVARDFLGADFEGERPEIWRTRITVGRDRESTPFGMNEVPLLRALRGEEVVNELTFVRTKRFPEGRWVEVSARPITDTGGRNRGAVSLFSDVTERKIAEEELRATADRLSVALMAADLGTWELNLSTMTLVCSDRCKAQYGRRPEDPFTYEEFEAAIHPDDLTRVRCIIADALTSNCDYHAEYRVVRLDGGVHWVMASGRLVHQKKGEPDRVVGITQDITERKLSEEGLRQRSEELLRSNVALSRFAYIASHDMKEPLRMVATYTQFLERLAGDKLDERASEAMRYIRDGSARAFALVEDLLAYSRLEAQHEPHQPLSTKAVIDDVMAGLRVAIDEAGAEVDIAELPEVAGNRAQVYQLFLNLVGNALKFRNGRAPRVSVEASSDEDGYVEFRVRDNGIGIEPQYFERIFVLFQRLHGRDRYPGTGLGLSICKRIVEGHGGRIWLNSEPHQGTCFHFTLPRA